MMSLPGEKLCFSQDVFSLLKAMLHSCIMQNAGRDAKSSARDQQGLFSR
jgi:hypothetical protein